MSNFVFKIEKRKYFSPYKLITNNHKFVVIKQDFLSKTTDTFFSFCELILLLAALLLH